MRNDPVLHRSVKTGRRPGSVTIRKLLVAAVFGTALAGSWPAPAAAAEDDVTIGMARERFKEGVGYFDQKQYDKARAAFLQAYALKRHPAVLLNLAQSELRSGHEADAAKHFAQYLREHKEATEAERQGAEAGLISAKALVAEVTVSADEEGAAVLIDGAAEGVTPLDGPVYLNPGARTITLRKDGRETSTQVNATAGQSSTVTLRLRKPAAGAAPAAPDPEHPRDAQGDQPAAVAETASPDEPSEPTSGRQSFLSWAAGSPVAWIGGGLFVAGVGAGVGFGLSAKSNYDNANSIAGQIRSAARDNGLDSARGICSDRPLQESFGPKRAEEYRTACAAYQDKVDSADQQKTFAIVGGAVAGVAAIGTVVLYFVNRGDEETAARAPRRATAQIVPWASPDAHGVVVSGEF